jgi:hypothetical protein
MPARFRALGPPSPRRICAVPTLDDAMTLFRQKHWAAAAAAFENLEKFEPTKTDALLFAGKSFVNLEHFADAANARHPGANAFEISDIQEEKSRAGPDKADQNVAML